MDTLFATKKEGKLSHGNTCCQLFVTDKGFLHVVPMKQKSEVFMAVKMFAKEIGAPNAIICDMAKEQMSAKLKGFLNDIGTTLRALEEGTPWANKAEFYIKLMKEAVWKDMVSPTLPSYFGITALRGECGLQPHHMGLYHSLLYESPHHHPWRRV